MNANYVHQRDVVTILDQFRADIDSVQHQLMVRPNEDPRHKIEKILKDTDRALRLKAQAVVRARLAQSRLIPMTRMESSSVYDDSAPTTPRATPRSLPQIVSTAPYTAAPSRLTVRRVNEAPPQMAKRRRRIPSRARHELPHYHHRDPAAEPKPLPPDSVVTYGIDALAEAGLMRPSEVRAQFSGLIRVSPYKRDKAVSPSGFQQHYVLDADHVDRRHIRLETEQEANNAGTPESAESTTTVNAKSVWCFELRYGIPVINSDEFQTFRQANAPNWEEIEIILDFLLRICEDRGLTDSRVDGQKILDLSKLDPDAISTERLLQCFVDRAALMVQSKSGFGFIGPNASDKAATRIQAIWRSYQARRLVRNLKRIAQSTRVLRRWFLRIVGLLHFRQKLNTLRKVRERQFDHR
jgi:hypothetical protein